MSDDGRASAKSCFQKAVAVAQGWGSDGVDILVNCGGIQRRHPSVDFPETDWDEVRPFPGVSYEALTSAKVLDVNLKSIFILSQAAGRHMIPRRRGKIINFASLLTFQVRPPPIAAHVP